MQIQSKLLSLIAGTLVSSAQAKIFTGNDISTVIVESGVKDLAQNPAFLHVDNGNMYVSTFFNNFPGAPPTGPADGVWKGVITNSAFHGDFESEEIVQTTWANKVTNGKIGDDDVIATAGGFLRPGFKGEVRIVFENEDADNDPNSGSTIKKSFRVSPDIGVYFYHKAIWMDMDGDNLEDLVTVRSTFTVPPMEPSLSQLVWFKNNGQTLQNTPDINDFTTWEEFLIDDGSILGGGDVDLEIYNNNIVATNFFYNGGIPPMQPDESSLIVYSLNGIDSWGTAKFPNNVTRTVISDDLGPPFGFEIKDLNRDGKDDILVTNHFTDGSLAKVFAIEIPEDFPSAGPYTTHVLAENFPNKAMNGASPGGAKSFYPSTKYKSQGMKPWIIVSGDGTSTVHVLTPTEQDKTTWNYINHILYDSEITSGGNFTIGAIEVVEDFDGTGCTQIWVPVFERKQVRSYQTCFGGAPDSQSQMSSATQIATATFSALTAAVVAFF